jgi:hypothetical protein
VRCDVLLDGTLVLLKVGLLAGQGVSQIERRDD